MKTTPRLSIITLLVAFTLGLAFHVIPAQAVTTVSDFSAIDAYVAKEMKAASMPGLAYGVVKDGKVVHLAAFGIADPSGRPMQTDTPLRIGSVGKTITALAIRQLIDAGKVDIEAPVQQYIPWFRVADENASAQITIRTLLEHTSGFSTAEGNNPDFYVEGPTSEELVRRLAQVPLDRPVGASREYSNFNYLVLGMVVQYASGETYEQYVQDHIFSPLGMLHSYFSESAAKQAGLAQGYQVLFGFPVPVNETYPAGLMAEGYQISTAADMANYLAAFSNHGQLGDLSIVTPDGKPAARSINYGLEWEPWKSSAPGEVLGHGGSTLTYTSQILFQPDEQMGVVVMTNTNTNQVVPTKNTFSIALDVLRMFSGNSPAPAVPGILQVFLVVDALLLVFIVLTVWHVLRIPRWRSRMNAAKNRVLFSFPAALLDWVLPLLLLLLFPVLLVSTSGAPETSILRSWSRLFFTQPDLSGVVCAIALALLVTGIIKAVALFRAKPAAQD